MSRYESDAHTTTQALRDVDATAQLITDYATTHPGQLIGLRIVLDLPEPPPDYQDHPPTTV